MKEKSPFFTATVASMLYLVILILLKIFLPSSIESAEADIIAELPGIIMIAVLFWIVIFVVHQLLIRRSSD